MSKWSNEISLPRCWNATGERFASAGWDSEAALCWRMMIQCHRERQMKVCARVFVLCVMRNMITRCSASIKTTLHLCFCLSSASAYLCQHTFPDATDADSNIFSTAKHSKNATLLRPFDSHTHTKEWWQTAACLHAYANTRVPMKTNTLLQFVRLLQLNSICRSMHTCKCLCVVSPCLLCTRLALACARQQRWKCMSHHMQTVDTLLHILPLPYAINRLSLSQSPKEWEDRPSSLQYIHTCEATKLVSMETWETRY